MIEEEFKDYTVTCHTEGCVNAEIAIPIPAPIVNPTFICGGCGQGITDIVG